MKILAISGSPRKGNTYSALQAIQEHFPEIDIEILMLKDLDFELCRGCYACVVRGEEKCPLRDDRNRLAAKMEEADGLILASPVYSHMIPALTKNLFDRFGYFAHRPQFFDKFALSVVTYSGYGAEPAVEYMNKLLGVFGFNVVPSLALQYRPARDTGAQQEENTRKTIEAFEVLLDRIRKGERDKPTLGKLIPFGIFKSISMVARETMPADYEYYKNKSDYYYDVKLPFHTKWIADRVVRKEVSRML